ncbi:hypothetical protein MIBA_04455 [Microbacterium proteolyticum]|nr:hypothetical protein [Microbacterium proteolyticum]MCI9857468.1 hypothetical protein [Microbacterium proteolyticum]
MKPASRRWATISPVDPDIGSTPIASAIATVTWGGDRQESNVIGHGHVQTLLEVGGQRGGGVLGHRHRLVTRAQRHTLESQAGARELHECGPPVGALRERVDPHLRGRDPVQFQDLREFVPRHEQVLGGDHLHVELEGDQRALQSRRLPGGDDDLQIRVGAEEVQQVVGRQPRPLDVVVDQQNVRARPLGEGREDLRNALGGGEAAVDDLDTALGVVVERGRELPEQRRLAHTGRSPQQHDVAREGVAQECEGMGA